MQHFLCLRAELIPENPVNLRRSRRDTRGPLGPRFFCATFLAAAALWARNPSWADLPGIDVEMDLRHSGSGDIVVVMSGMQPSSGAASFLITGDPAIQIKNLELETAAGTKLPLDRIGNRLRVAELPAGGYRVRYTASPGGSGRHGNQGNADERFAVFDGRVLVLPEAPPQWWPVRFRFELPEGWRAVSPYPTEAGRYVAGMTPLTRSRELLETTCQAFGPFEARTERFGNTDVSVHVYADWKADHKHRLAERSLNLYRAFHDRFGFDPGGIQQIVWTPRSAERRRVFGGASAIANCLEMPEENPRGYELLAHRLAHALNKYEPIGIKTAPGENRWFNEGWATYEEIAATRAAGLVEDDRRWNGWYRSYLYTAQRNPASSNWPLSRDHEASPALAEFLHYRKSPLVMAMLEYQVRSVGGRTLADFVRTMYPRYRNGRKSFPFRRELEQYTGRDLGRFWETMVRGAGPAIPVWPEYFTDENFKRPPAGVAATVGNAELHPDLLFELAESGRFERYADIVAFLKEAAARKDMPETIWQRHYPPELQRHRLTVPGLVAVLLKDYEDRVIPAARRFDGRRIRFSVNRNDSIGAVVQALLDAETEYLRQTRAGPVSAVRIRKLASRTKGGAPPVLAIQNIGKLGIEVVTRDRGRQLTVDWLGPNGEFLASRALPVDARRAEFEVGEEALQKAGAHCVRVTEGGRTLVERSFWLRERSPL
jgi:hypothetical protein